MNVENNKYAILLKNIGNILINGRNKVNKAINIELLKTKWEIGQHIVVYEQEGNETAEYGSDLLNKLSKDLKVRYGKGFSRRNVLDMRRFYVFYSNWQTVSANLSWSHYVELIGIKNELERKFYEKQCLHEGWSIREFQRAKNSSLFERIAVNKTKDEILVEYATDDINKNLFVSEYQLYLPDKKELELRLNKILNETGKNNRK